MMPLRHFHIALLRHADAIISLLRYAADTPPLRFDITPLLIFSPYFAAMPYYAMPLRYADDTLRHILLIIEMRHYFPHAADY